MTQPSLSALCGVERALSTFEKNAPGIYEDVTTASGRLQYSMNAVIEREVATSPPRLLSDRQQWAILRVAQLRIDRAVPTKKGPRP
jgi:hypothetical protein